MNFTFNEQIISALCLGLKKEGKVKTKNLFNALF